MTEMTRREFVRLAGLALLGSAMPAWVAPVETGFSWDGVPIWTAEAAALYGRRWTTLDCFGISSSRVRDRISELEAEAWIDGDRPAIFMRTVMEVGEL